MVQLTSATLSVNITSEREEDVGTRSTVEARDLLELASSVNLTENSIEDVLEEAANYTIKIAGDVNKKFITRNKKYRLMKIVRSEPWNQPSQTQPDQSHILRNIKLEVDGAGNKKVPNLFKIRRKVKYPNYVRKHRQIYRGDIPSSEPDKTGRTGDRVLAENSVSESQLDQTYSYPPVVLPSQNHLQSLKLKTWTWTCRMRRKRK